ncbi:MAG: AMP-binding protein [Deltaproteobacteria bacterium]|nr:AMP-binding protein [Deltaproteobacteria bacterium]
MKQDQTPSTLLERYRHTLANHPNRTAFIWVDRNANETLSYTYEELDLASRAVAQLIMAEGVKPGDTVLLAYGPGFDFFLAFWGCLISGIVAAPVTPPISSKDVGKFLHLNKHCEAKLILTDKRFARLLKAKAYKEKISKVGQGMRSLLGGQRDANEQPPYSKLLEERWITSSGIPEPDHILPLSPHAPDSTAFIMYSSGSTRAPKGALTTFGNLNHQLEMNGKALTCSPDHVSCWWAPHYHDYGLISGFLNVIYQGCKGVLASPFDFIQRPPLWLDMLHKYKGTHTFGPDFGYDLLIRKTSQQDRQNGKWDLSSLKIAMSAAEKVRAATIDAFSAAFAPCGYKREVFCPAYGLAEHTVGVTINGIGDEPVIQRFLRKPLEEHGKALPAEVGDDFEEASDERVLELVGNGVARHNTDLQIVKINSDGDPLETMPPGRVGEVWVASGSKTIGYFKEPELTRTAFHARLPGVPDNTNEYLRTGDLGFISAENGELFICGRQKDMIILAGKNHYSEDLEVTLSTNTRQYLRPGRIAAVSYEETTTSVERLAIVAEVRSPDLDEPTVFNAIRTCLAAEHKVDVSTIALIQSGSIPKTSSGKLRRFEARERLLDNTLDTLPHGIWTAPVSDFNSMPGYEETLAMILRTLTQLTHSPSPLPPETSLPALNLSQLAVGELIEAINKEHPHAAIRISTLLKIDTATALAAHLIEGDATGMSKAREPMPDLKAHPTAAADTISTVIHPLLYAQEAALKEHLNPFAEPNNLMLCGWLQGDISLEALQKAVEWLTERQSALRTTFEQRRDGSYGQLVQPDWSSDNFYLEDAENETEAYSRVHTLIGRHLNLEQSSFDFHVFRLSSDKMLIAAVLHPAICDHWSLNILRNELAQLYAQAKDNVENPDVTGALPYQLVDVAHWQQGLLQTHAFDRRIGFWKTYLRGTLEHLRIPADRNPGASLEAISTALKVGSEAMAGLKAACARWKTDLRGVFITAYATVLSRHYRQRELIIQTPIQGRLANTENLIAPCSEATLVRVRVPRKTSFRDMASANDSTFHQAIEHDIPLSLLHDALGHDASLREHLSWAVLSIQEPPKEQVEELRSFKSEVFQNIATSSLTGDRLPLHSHSIMDLKMNEKDELEGNWRCKAALMNQRELDALAIRFQRILEAVSQSTREGPSLEDTIEMRVIKDESPVSSVRLFGSKQDRKTKDTDISRPALKGDGSPRQSRGQDYGSLPVGSRMLFGSIASLPPEKKSKPDKPNSEGED